MSRVPFIVEYKGIQACSSEPLEDAEVVAYIERGIEKFGDKLGRVILEVDGDYVGVTYLEVGDYHPFERIRRITGYLVGTLDRFNDAKRSEVEDRVKHTA